jgi:preprotein translocase subunit YajC
MSRLLSIAFLVLSTAAVAFAAPGDAAPAGGPEGVPAAAPNQGSPLFMILMMVGVFAFMWFVMIRPQKKEEKRRKEMIEATKRGDKVVTIGGAHGTVEAVGEGTIDVRLGGDGDKGGVVVTFNKAAVSANLSGEQAAKGK